VSALTFNALIDAATLGPVTTIRSATTSVVVRDKQTVVIGGLIADATDNRENSVPFIGDIPVIGNLFRTTSGRREKINLLIFLTPHIIRDAREHRDKSITERDELKAHMEEQGIRYRKRKILDHPSWTPDIPEDDATGQGATETRPGKGATIYTPPALPPVGATTAAPPMAAAASRRPDTAPIIDAPVEVPPSETPVRFVLLAAFAERGTPPPGLQSSSGLVAVELPSESSLTTLFKPGGQYRFSSDKFEGYYRVLEAYRSGPEAFLVYPEGLMVDPAKGEQLRWRSFDDATSADASAWTALH
jgi:hypothetical protein